MFSVSESEAREAIELEERYASKLKSHFEAIELEDDFNEQLERDYARKNEHRESVRVMYEEDRERIEDEEAFVYEQIERDLMRRRARKFEF